MVEGMCAGRIRNWWLSPQRIKHVLLGVLSWTCEAGVASDKSTHRWRSVDLSEYNSTFFYSLMERDISTGLIWVKSVFILLSIVNGCLLG